MKRFGFLIASCLLLSAIAAGEGLIIRMPAGAIGIAGSPPAPVGLVEAEPTGTTTIQVSWTDDAAPEAPSRTFVVERSTDGENWSEIGTPTASPFNDTGRTPGTLYHYRVTASNFWGAAVPLSATATTESEGAPDAPSGLAATALGSSSIGLTWTDNSDNETNFELQRATENTFASPTTIEPAANATSYTATGLTPETTYYFRNRAVNGTGDSSWSSTVSATTAAEGAAPEFALTAIPDATVGVTSSIAAWYAEHGATNWWMWQVRLIPPFEGDGPPNLLVASHRAGNGIRIYENDGEFGFTDITNSFGPTWNQYSFTTGGYIPCDYDHDGYIDLVNFGEVSHKNAIYDPDTDQLSLVSAPWQNELPSVLSYIEEDESGYLRFIQISMQGDTGVGQWPVNFDLQTKVYSWNGTGYTKTITENIPVDTSGIPSEVLDEVSTYLDDGSHAADKRYASIRFQDVDINLDGVNEKIISVSGSYEAAFRYWILTNNGDGTYTDRTSEWGLSGVGQFLTLGQLEFRRPIGGQGNGDSTWLFHKQISGGRAWPDLFISNNTTTGGHHGHYKWNGSGYTRSTTSPITARIGLSDTYAKRIYVCDLTNSGHLDIVLHRLRSGYPYIYINDGSDNFTEYYPGRQLRAWDADGMCIDDVDGDGLLDFILGGDGGVDSGVTSGITARCLSIWHNETANPGNYLKVKLRRTGSPNLFAMRSKIEVFEAGQSFADSALIRMWYARPDGMGMIFGVGSNTTVDVRVTWPDQSVSTQTNVSVNQTMTITGE